MTERKLAPVIHITGVQRSGHSFIGNVITTNLGIAWWKQHDGEPWVVKAMLREQWTAIRPDVKDWLKVVGPKYQEIALDTTATHDDPPPEATFGSNTVTGLKAVRVTEYQHPLWFERHVLPHAKKADININVIRDPRNLLASAIGKGWDQKHCEELMSACEYQYVSEDIKSYINISYELTLAHLTGDDPKKVVAGIEIEDWARDAVLLTQKAGGNTSFGPTSTNADYSERYKRPDMVTNPIFQSLISKAEEIYNTHHVPFLNSIK